MRPDTEHGVLAGGQAQAGGADGLRTKWVVADLGRSVGDGVQVPDASEHSSEQSAPSGSV